MKTSLLFMSNFVFQIRVMFERCEFTFDHNFNSNNFIWLHRYCVMFQCFRSRDEIFVQSKWVYQGRCWWWCSYAFQIKENCKKDTEHNNNYFKVLRLQMHSNFWKDYLILFKFLQYFSQLCQLLWVFSRMIKKRCEVF